MRSLRASDIAAVGTTAAVAGWMGLLAVITAQGGQPVLAAGLALAGLGGLLAAGRLCLRPEVRRRATMALAAAALPAMGAMALLLVPAGGIKGLALAGILGHTPALAGAVAPQPKPRRASTPLASVGPAPQHPAPAGSRPAQRPQSPRAPPAAPVARSGRALAPAHAPKPAPCLSAYSRKEYITMQITLAHHVFHPDLSGDDLVYRNCAEIGEVDLVLYLHPPTRTFDESKAPLCDPAAWVRETKALAARAGSNLGDVLDFAADYFRQRPNDNMGLLSVATFAEWRETKRIIRPKNDKDEINFLLESKGYNPHTIAAFNDALSLLRMLRARMVVTYRPKKGAKLITVTEDEAIYHVSPVTVKDRKSGETLATAWRMVPGAIAILLRRVGQYYSLPKAVMALDARYAASAKTIARYIIAMHRISGRSAGVLPWDKAMRVACVSATTARNTTRTRDRIMAGLQELTAGPTPVFAALRAAPSGIAYTLGALHPTRTPRPAVRRGVRRISRVVRTARG